MEILLILLVIIIGIIFIVLKLCFAGFKVLFSIISFIMLISLVVGTVIAYKVIMDANDFKVRIQSEDSIYLLDQGGRFIAGMVTRSGNNVEEKYLKQDELTALQGEYIDDGFSTVPEGTYKIFVVSMRALEGAQYEEAPNNIFSKDFYIALMLDPEPIRGYAEKQAYLNQVPETAALIEDQLSQQYDAVQFRGSLFGELFFGASKQNPFFLISGIKQKTITVHPQSPMFKYLPLIPNSVMETVAEKIPKT